MALSWAVMPICITQAGAAIMSLEMATVNFKTVLNTRSTVSDLLDQGKTVAIRWDPGHFDVQGNKRADELAKQLPL